MAPSMLSGASTSFSTGMSERRSRCSPLSRFTAPARESRFVTLALSRASLASLRALRTLATASWPMRQVIWQASTRKMRTRGMERANASSLRKPATP